MLMMLRQAAGSSLSDEELRQLVDQVQEQVRPWSRGRARVAKLLQTRWGESL